MKSIGNRLAALRFSQRFRLKQIIGRDLEGVGWTNQRQAKQPEASSCVGVIGVHSIVNRGQFLRNPDQATLRRTGLPMFDDRTFAFEVADNSMIPRFPAGSYLICTETNREDMVKGLPYVLTTDAQLLIALYDGKQEEELRFSYLNDSRKELVEEQDVHGAYHIELLLGDQAR